MAVTQRLELRQSQTLVMTPQLRQAIQLLQFSSLELNAFVDRQLEENPLLERDDSQTADTGSLDSEGQAQEASDVPDSVSDYGEAEGPPDSLDRISSGELSDATDRPLDTEPVYDDNSPSESLAVSSDWGSQGPTRQSGGGDERTVEDAADESPDLRTHLLRQLPIEVHDPAERIVAAYLIDQVEPSGYFLADVDAIAVQLGVEAERLEGLEPTGVFARDLAECLSLQLRERNRFDPCMAAMLANLNLLAQGKLEQLRTLCGVDEADFHEMLAEIRALDPKPGLQFDQVTAEPVIPDVLMRARPDGTWLLELNPDAMPRLLVNRNYYAATVSRCRDRAERNYLTEQLGAASWLVKSLHQRATTIIKVASEIVRQQEKFFRKGVAHMRPLTLRDVAEEVSLHESTVSRVTANKYIATPRGIFEFKYFFSTAVGGEGEEAHAAESIRHRIRSLIDAETAGGVLSDDALVKHLRKEGISVARRTVAKYREAMKIPSSVERRRLKAAQSAIVGTDEV